jgi:spore germination cell wall hydrolase CwlJ-like protein
MSAFDDAVAARTIWGEARGEGAPGMLAVAWVIKNRVLDGRWGKTAAAVCLAPLQFSCWNRTDPNRQKLLEIDETDRDFEFAGSWWVAADLNERADPTNGASHYKVIGTPAAWSLGQAPCATIGKHAFYKNIP